MLKLCFWWLLFQLVLIGLNILTIISISWCWVFFPLWLPPLIGLIVVIFFVLAGGGIVGVVKLLDFMANSRVRSHNADHRS